MTNAALVITRNTTTLGVLCCVFEKNGMMVSLSAGPKISRISPNLSDYLIIPIRACYRARVSSYQPLLFAVLLLAYA